MIKQLFMDGVDVSTNGYYPIALSGIASASIDYKSYPLGSRYGVALGTPRLRSLKIKLDILVVGNTIADYISKRDNLLQVFSLVSDPTLKQTKELKIIDDADITRIGDVVVVGNTGDLNSSEKNYGTITFLMETDREYLRGSDKSQDVYLSKGGGFAIPFAIPFDMSVSTGSQIVEMVNAGNSNSFPVVRVYGDLLGFTLHNVTTNKSLTTTTTLGVNDYIDIDFYNRTMVKNGITNILNTKSGDWWTLIPGSNVVKLISSSTSTVAHAAFTYQNAYIGL